ncbi:MAG: hypothetical protein VKL42_11270 [Snowella sp.]|nr:hypothetical protein [Snowella sp.]
MELDRLKWIKNVRPIGASIKDWAYDENGVRTAGGYTEYDESFFRLMFWEKPAAYLPKIGDLAFLKQHNKLTHLIEFVKDIDDITTNLIGKNAVDREVKIIWWVRSREEMRQLPAAQEILGYEPGVWPGTYPRPYYECGDFERVWGEDDRGFKAEVARNLNELR